MRRLTAVVPVLLLAVACGTIPRAPDRSSWLPPTNRVPKSKPVVPLQASLLPPTHGIGFYVNKQAYIGVFDITPGRGIGLVYPRMGRDLDYAVHAGPQWISTSTVPYWPASFETSTSAPGVSYLFLVASKQPLNIDDYVGYSDYLREKWGNAAYTGNAYSAMKALVSEVVPAQPDEDWTTALYIVYGGTGRRATPQIYQLVLCTNRRMYWVRLGEVFLCPAAADSTASDSVAGKTLKEGEPKPADQPKSRRRTDILLFDPANGPAAAELLRRPAMKVERPPMPPEPRIYEPPPTYSNRRSDPVLSGVTPTTVVAPASTVQTAAQEPSNPRGRVSEDPQQ